MLTALRNWMTEILIASVFLSVAEKLVPEGSVRKIASMTGGLILLTVLVRPMAHFRSAGFQLDTENYAAAIQERQTELREENENALSELIEERTAAYISDKAAGLGLTVTVRVETEPGADGTPLPERVYLEGTKSEELSHWLAEELGIPAERQVWNGQETGN